jgi:hypothetical protein
MSDKMTISVHDLHRLLPSDIERMTLEMPNPGFAAALLETYGSYLKRLTKPLAVELDDVTRITVQLSMTGLWRLRNPKTFIQATSSDLDPLVIEEFCDTLRLDLDQPRQIAAGSAAAE